MTLERLKEINHILWILAGKQTTHEISGAIQEIIGFAVDTIKAQPVPCDHSKTYPVSHVSDQIVTMCNGCGQVLEIKERKDNAWVTVRETPKQIILNVPSKCQRCGMNCERCTR